jgi:hypothetical protein
MDWGNIEVSTEAIGEHSYSVHQPHELGRWLDAIADEYVSLRTDCTVPLPQALDLAGIGVLSVESLRKRLAHAVVPKPDLERGNLSTTRSDLSEVAAYMTLEKIYNTKIGYKLIRDRETAELPGRGIDAIGLEVKEKLLVVLAEVKFSDEGCQPKAPQVVDRGANSMRNQHLGHLREHQETVSKLYDCCRRIRDTTLQTQYLAAALYIQEKKWDRVGVICCCILVRPRAKHSQGDFGTFRNQPNDYSPAAIRFIIITLPDDIEQVLSAWSTAVNMRRYAS